MKFHLAMINNNYFETTSTLFSRAQALIWATNGLAFLDVFEKSSGKLLADIINKCPVEKTFLINFKGVIRFDDHCLDDVFYTLEGNLKQVIILNGESLLGDLYKLKKEKNVNITHNTEKKIIVLGRSEISTFELFLEEKETCKENYISTILKNTFKRFENYQRLCSTPFFANGEFDAKKIIESPKDFMWISFYLSDALSKIIESEKLSNVILVSASLRGAVFTSILAIINDLEYLNIDHIGPIHNVYNFKYTEYNNSEVNYLYIGDFVFGGTEIKLTKVYVGFGGAKLNHALVLGSLFEADAFKDFKLYELSRLKNISADADFKLFN